MNVTAYLSFEILGEDNRSLSAFEQYMYVSVITFRDTCLMLHCGMLVQLTRFHALHRKHEE